MREKFYVKQVPVLELPQSGERPMFCDQRLSAYERAALWVFNHGLISIIDSDQHLGR